MSKSKPKTRPAQREPEPVLPLAPVPAGAFPAPPPELPAEDQGTGVVQAADVPDVLAALLRMAPDHEHGYDPALTTQLRLGAAGFDPTLEPGGYHGLPDGVVQLGHPVLPLAATVTCSACGYSRQAEFDPADFGTMRGSASSFELSWELMTSSEQVATYGARVTAEVLDDTATLGDPLTAALIPQIYRLMHASPAPGWR